MINVGADDSERATMGGVIPCIVCVGRGVKIDSKKSVIIYGCTQREQESEMVLAKKLRY